jgi:YrbI family 3-deoxy-D-manno-octulosonate 8-phosphate phosphatase
MNLAQLCSRIRLLLSDVDGVMTDGGFTFTGAGDETKTFHIRDGMGIRLWQRAGGQFGMVTGRKSSIVERRAAELGVTLLRQGSDDKLPFVQELAIKAGVSLEETAYIGDDLPDLAAIRAVGLGIAVADAVEEIRTAAKYTTSVPGGEGAVREVVELLLKNTNKWEATVAQY